MAPTLDDLLGDGRLARLFSSQNRACALQLWVLRIESEPSPEIRIVYGRLLPYSHTNNCWSFSDNNKHKSFGDIRVKLERLNLYLNSNVCEQLLRQLCDGYLISQINEEMGLDCPKKLTKEFGSTTLGSDNLSYRPVAYLLNQDAHDRRSFSSPHGSAGAFSASITRMDKEALFFLNSEYSTDLTSWLVERLNRDTGLDFGRIDATRFGDLELLVFPTLNDHEQNLLSVKWTNSPLALTTCFDPEQVPCFKKFLFHLKILNDGHTVSSTIASVNRDEKGVFEHAFQVSEELRERADSTELEIFGFTNDNPHEGVLCCRWRIGYLRELNFQGHMRGQEASPVKFDWLERATRPAMSYRVKVALSVSRGGSEFGSRIGGREADPWVAANRELSSLFTRINPPKSEGRFFQRWSMGDGEGRLQFVEWFKSLLAKYQQHQILIFDPYFETAGLGLVLICAQTNSDYIVFTSLPKPSQAGEAAQGDCEKPIVGRVNNLIASCEQNSHLLSRIKFSIYGLKEGRLHDRYVLVMGANELPIAGFHLSNSFQNAAENFPLLITPIPADVLLEVEQYKSDLVKEAKAAQFGGETKNSAMSLLFDSKAPSAEPRRYEPLSFIEKPGVGSVLGVWSGESSLNGLMGDQLRTQMKALGLLKDNSLLLADGLKNCIAKQAVSSKDFTPTWEVLGEILAHSFIGDMDLSYLESEREFLEFLNQFLSTSFERVYDNSDKELATVDVQFFCKTVEELLCSPYRTDQLFHSTKYAALTWSEYFAVRFLWRYEPNYLLKIAESQISFLVTELDKGEAVRLSLLSQIISEVSLSIEGDIDGIQLETLVNSGHDVLRWLGLNAVERQLDSDTRDGFASSLSVLDALSSRERVRALGWMVNHAAKDTSKEEVFRGLVAALHKVLPEKITVEELELLVDSMLGHMRQLAWAEPWLFKDVVLPLLQSERTSTEDACHVWVLELSSILEPLSYGQSRLFDRAHEGQMTKIASFLFASSSSDQREATLTMLNKILRSQQRVLHQPLASTLDWTRWDDALRVSLWILAFGRWSEFYLRERSESEKKLEQLSQDAHDLAMRRPIEEWQSERPGMQEELFSFLKEAEKRLDDSKFKSK